MVTVDRKTLLKQVAAISKKATTGDKDSANLSIAGGWITVVRPPNVYRVKCSDGITLTIRARMLRQALAMMSGDTVTFEGRMVTCGTFRATLSNDPKMPPIEPEYEITIIDV